MKRKRFLLTMLFSALGVLFGGSNLLAQFQTVTSSLPADLNDYFFVIKDHNNTGLTLVLGQGGNQGNNYRTLWYRANVDPLTNRNALMTIVQDDNYQVVTCAGYPDYMLQTENDASWYYRTHDNGGGNIAWGHMTFSYNNGWTVQNGVYPDNHYWGTWRDSGGNAREGDEIAANKSTVNRSTYDISAIKRGQYLQNALVDNLNESVDISYVITNPGAEYGTAGWTVENGFQVQGNHEYSQKVGDRYFQRWQSQNNGYLNNCSMYQELTEMKGGYYTISVKTGVSATGAYLFANDQQVDLSTKDGDGRVSVTVHVNDGNTLKFGVKLEGYQSNWVYFDDFKMTFVGSTSFLYNLGASKFLARGADWGTRAVIDSYGLPIEIVNSGNNTVNLKFIDTNQYLFLENSDNIYTDNGDRTPAAFTMTSEVVNGKTVCKFQYNGGGYLSFNGQNIALSNSDGKNVQWQLMTASERNEIVNNYPAKNLEDVMTQARSNADDYIYSAFPPANYISSEMEYWIRANYQTVDMTDRITNSSFTDGDDDWGYSHERNGVTKNSSDGIVEQFQTPGTWTQTIQELPEGIYKLTVNAFERHGSPDLDKRLSPYGNIGSAFMSAGGQQVHIAAWHEEYTEPANPNNLSQAATKLNSGHYNNELYFYVQDNEAITITVSMPGYLGVSEWFAMDNFTLTRYIQDTRTIATPTGTYYYLRNKDTGEYVTFDGYWGTYYSMSDVGKQLTLETSSDGTTLMHTTYLSNTDDVTSSHNTENYFYSYPGNIEHAFSNGNSTEGGEKWVFYSDGNGGYSIMNFMTGYYLSGSQGYDSNNRGWGGQMKSTDTDPDTKWELVSFDELKNALTANGTYPKDASFLIDEPDFIVGYNNVYKEFYSWKVMGNDQFKYSDWVDTNIISFHSQNNGVSEGNVAYAYSQASDYPDILQTITGIPNGLYVVECQAAFRDGNIIDAIQDQEHYTDNPKSSSRLNEHRLTDGTYVNRAYLFANDNLGTEPTDARLIRDRFWIYENAQLMPVKIATDEHFAANDNLLSAFKSKEYTVQIPIYVTTGELTIGVLQEIGINDNLLVFDRFRLKYYGTNYSGDEVKNIAKGNLEKLSKYYEDTDNHTAYQKKTITNKEIEKVTTAISDINSDWSNTSSTTISKYNKVAQDYGETSISWYIYNVLQNDYDRGDYTTAAPNSNREESTARYPFVDEASKKEVVKYFGAGTAEINTNNAINYYENYGEATYTADTKFGSSANMKTNGELSDLRAAISAIRAYVEANAEARYVEDEKVKDGALEDTEEARRIARETRMALVTGRADAITSEDGLRPAYDINPLMFGNTGAIITAPNLNKVVHNARCWAPRDAYGYRFYDYTNYYYWGNYDQSYTIDIEGLMTGKYLVTISESHNNNMNYVYLNAYVGTGTDKTQIVTNKDLLTQDQSVWQTYTHSWQDVSCVVNITDRFEPVELTFTGNGNGGGTMNICNLRIYRMEDVQMILFDEDATILAKNGMDLGNNKKGYNDVKALLRRSMAKNQWNTLVLPVDLTKEQVIAGFGEGTILATMDGFSEDYGQPDNCIHFTTDDLSDKKYQTAPAIEEGKVYLIKPTADPAVSSDEQVYFKNSYEHRNSYEPVNGPIYYLDYVNYRVTEGEKNPAEGQEEKVAHTAPSTTQNPIIYAAGQQEGKLNLQMRGTYGKTAVPVNATENGGTNYIYAFQQQSDNKVYLVELDPSKGESRQFKGYRGWAVANYTESAPVRQSYLVLLDEGDDQLTVIRGIDSEEGYSEVKIPRQGVYDMQGRSIDRKEFYSGSYPQGVYIVDGKKVVRK